MKRLFKVINLTIAGVLVFIAIGVAYIALPFFGNQALIVRSGSMSPTIEVGSVAVVRKSLENYNKGDVIAFISEKNKETITTHRIVEKVVQGNAVLYRTKGDANDNPDAVLVKQENILGKTFIVIPYVGKILGFAKSDIGFPAFIIFPAVFVIVIEAWSIIKEIRKRRRLNSHFGFVNFDLRKQHKGSLISLKLIIPILALSLFIPSTLAYFSDSETSTGNIFQASSEFPQPCEDGVAYATSVVSAVQGTLKNDSPITDPNRTDPNKVLGTPDWTSGGSTGFFSLGKNGFIEIMFEFPISAVAPMKIYEATNGRAGYPEETATVSASLDGTSFTNIAGSISSEPGGDGVNEVTLPALTKFVRVWDTTNFGPHANNADGFDIDAFEGEVVCEEL